MSTAHRPTWAPAKGGEQAAGTRVYAPSRQTSAKNQNSHTQLKFRCVACWRKRAAGRWFLGNLQCSALQRSSLLCQDHAN